MGFAEGFNAMNLMYADKARNEFAWAEYAQQKSDKLKNEMDRTKALRQVVKAYAPEGMAGDDARHLAETGSYGDLEGYIQGQVVKQAKQKQDLELENLAALAEQRRTGAMDEQTFKQVLQSYAPEKTLDESDDEDLRGYDRAPAAAGGKVDPMGLLLQFYRAGGSPRGGAWAAQAFHNLLNGGYGEQPEEGVTSFGVPYSRYGKTIQYFPGVPSKEEGPTEDPTGKYYWNGKSWTPKKEMPEPGAEPIKSPDGKMYWDGKVWKPVKESPFESLVNAAAKAKGASSPAPNTATKTNTPVLRFRKGKDGKPEQY